MRVVGTLDIPEAAAGTPAAGSERFFADPTSTVNKLFVRNSAGVLVPAGFGNPMTTAGDVIVAGASGAAGRIAKGANDTVFGVDTTGTVGFRALPTASIVRLDHTPVVDPAGWAPLNVAASTNNLTAALNFTVGQSTSLIGISLPGEGIYTASSGGQAATVQALIDGTTVYKLGSNFSRAGSGSTNPFVNGGPVWIAGLAAGVHTIQIQVVFTGSANQMYFRPATAPTSEWMHLMVVEIAAGGPTGPIGPSAQTAGGSKVQLAYVAASDLWGGTAFSAGTWTNFTSAFSFTVDDAASQIEIAVRSSTYYSHTGSECMTRLLVDGALAGKLGGFAGTANGNPFAGADPVWISGLAAGAHTATVQIFDNSTPGLMYCRAATQPDIEHFAITVIEHKQGGLSWTYQGAWSAVTTYAIKDVVTLNGASYVAIAAGINHSPDVSPTFWSVLAQKGTDGTNGTNGAPGAPISRLNASASVDVWNAAGGGAGVYTVDGPRSFTIGASSSIVEFDVMAAMLAVNTSGGATFQIRLLIDATTYTIGGNAVPSGSGVINPFAGINSLKISGLSPGSHNVTVQLAANSAANTLYFRPATVASSDFLRIQVTEYATTFAAWLYRGAWSSATAYAAADFVTLNGIGYLAIASSTNQSPDTSPTYWVVIAAPGSITNPMTTTGDLIIGGTSGVPARLAKGANQTVVGVDVSGNVGYQLRRHRAKLTNNTTQSCANSSFVVLGLNTLVVQTPSGMVEPHANAITAVEAGWYEGSVWVEFGANSTGDRRVYIQTGSLGTIANHQQPAGTTGPSGISCPFGIELAAGDYVFAYVLQSATGGGSLTISAGATLSMQKVA